MGRARSVAAHPGVDMCPSCHTNLDVYELDRPFTAKAPRNLKRSTGIRDGMSHHCRGVVQVLDDVRHPNRSLFRGGVVQVSHDPVVQVLDVNVYRKP